MFHTKSSFFIGIAALVLLVSACSRQEVPTEPLRAVKVVTVGEQEVQRQGWYAGELRAQVESRLAFRVGGKLLQRSVDLGQRVTAGQVLASLDAQDYQLSQQAAQAQVQAAQAQHDVARDEFKRFEGLRAQGFISAAELDRRALALTAAQQALVQAQAQAQAQRNQVAYAQLRADAAGVVTGLEAEAGQVVGAGQTVLRLAHDGPRDAVFSVPEQEVQAFRVGLPMQARLAGSGQVLAGRVREVAASADPLTRTFAVKLALEASQALPLGLTVEVRMPTLTSERALSLPTTALLQQSGGVAVWVLDEAQMTVRLQPVTVGTVQADRVAIAQGLQAGQRVVVAGVHVLSPGQKVMLYGAPSAAPAPAAAQAK